MTTKQNNVHLNSLNLRIFIWAQSSSLSESELYVGTSEVVESSEEVGVPVPTLALGPIPPATNGPTSASRTLDVTIQSAAKAAIARGSFVVDGVVVQSAERRLVPSELSGADRGAGTPWSRRFPASSWGPRRGRGRDTIDSYVKSIR